MTHTDQDDFPYGHPSKEQEEPINPAQLKEPDPMTIQKIAIGEHDKKRRDKRYFSAFKLIVGCLAILSFIFLIDVFSNWILNHQPSSITKDIIEIIKTLLFTLSGYLFAKKESGD